MSDLKRYGIAGGTGGQTMPFARAVQAADGWLYVSGQTPMVNGEVIEGGIVTQSHQCIQNVMAILKEAGYGPEQIMLINGHDIKTSLLHGLKLLLSLYLLFILTAGGIYNILSPFDEAPEYHRVFQLIEQFSYPPQYYHSKRYLEIFIYYGWAVFDIIAAGLALLMLWQPIQIKNKWLLWLPFIANTSIFFYFCLIMYRVL